MALETDIRCFVKLKQYHPKFDQLFEEKIESLGIGNDIVYTACRILNETVGCHFCHIASKNQKSLCFFFTFFCM